MYTINYYYDYIGTSLEIRCKKCGDCISWYQHNTDKNNVYFCQHCGYGYQVSHNRILECLPKDFRPSIEKDL